MLASEFGTGQVFWSMLWFFLWFIWLWLLITIFGDIFRRHDISGLTKTLWSIFVIVFPFLGIVIYLTVRGTEMGQREWASTQASDHRLSRYIRRAAGHEGGTVDEFG